MDTTKDSLFTKIIKGEIPCHKIYEDDQSFAFLDIHPIQTGHTLVIPKRQVAYVWDLSAEEYQAVMATAQKIALALRAAFPDKKLTGMHVEGLDIPHAHVHVYPFNTAEEFHTLPDADAEPDHAALADIAARLTAHLR